MNLSDAWPHHAKDMVFCAQVKIAICEAEQKSGYIPRVRVCMSVHETWHIVVMKCDMTN